jgi:hypothetical protein
LSDVTDVTTTSTELNQLHTSGAVLADFVKLHAVTASAADLSLLQDAAAGTGLYNAGALTATNLSYLFGTTSNIQTQLNNKQALDADLTAISAMSTYGIVVRSAADTWVTRSLVAPAAGFTITEPAGLLGNPTFALANDLAALEGLTTFGYVVRTADGAATTRAIVGTVGNIVVTNGDGVASDTSVNLAAVTQDVLTTGKSFLKVSLDGFGRVIGNTPVLTSDITSLVDATYVNAAGDTMTGSLVMATGTHITLTDTAVSGTDAVNKAYVDAMSQGLSWKNAVRAATTVNISISAPGATLDGVTLVSGDRVLVKNQTAAAENGIYVFNGATAALTRAIDMDVAAEFAGAAVLVQEGATQMDFGYTETAVVTTVGTSAVHFSQFTGSSVLTPGVGLYQTSNVLNVALGAGVAELPTQEVGIDLYNAAGGNLALILTTDGTTHSTATSAKLHLLLDNPTAFESGLEQTASGLKIHAAGVTNAMLLNPSVTLNSDTGTSTLALGGTLQVIGTSTQGITTSNTANTITLTALSASATQRGVATFNTASFDVSPATLGVGGGDVTIKTAGVTNLQLVNSTINFVGSDTSADLVSLGETLTFADVTGGHASGALIKSSMATNTLTLSARQASTTELGVASFNATMFSVAAGAVTIASTLGTVGLSNVNSTVDSATANDLLTYAAGKWVNATRAAVLNTQSVNDLADVTVVAPAQGQVLSWDTTAAAWINKKMYHVETVAVAATTWTVTHSLGVKYCNVTIVVGDEVVIPQSITFNGTTQLTVVFNTAVAGEAVVMGLV